MAEALSYCPQKKIPENKISIKVTIKGVILCYEPQYCTTEEKIRYQRLTIF